MEKKTTSNRVAVGLWASMQAEYLDQWTRQAGKSPVDEHGKMSAIGHKWSEVAMMATDDDGTMVKAVLSQAIKDLRKRENKSYLPTLGEFEDAVLNARSEYREIERNRKAAEDMSKRPKIEVKPKTPEQIEADALKYKQNRRMFVYMSMRSLSGKHQRQRSLSLYLAIDPNRSRWKAYVRALKKAVNDE